MITALHNLGMRHRTDKATYHHYCDFYEEHLPRDVTRLLEIGVMDGASLRMWRDYYPGAAIVGIDILPRKPVRGCVVMQGDATRGMDAVRAEVYGPFDVIVDDGSHMTLDQQVSLGLLWGGVNPGGCYVVEDLHTSFMPNYVNSAYNTVEVLRSVEPGDPEWPGIAAIEWYSRTGKYDGDDSITAIIKKAP